MSGEATNKRVQKTMNEIQPADPGARRKALWILGIATLIGVCAILAFEYFQEDLRSWLERNIDYLIRNSVVVFLGAVVFALPVLAAGIFLFLFGNRTVRSQRFPPPDYAVTRDTRVLKGLQATRRGRIIQLLSLLLMVAAGTLPFVILQIFGVLGQPN